MKGFRYLLLFFMMAEAHADVWKVRVKEHYDILELEEGGVTQRWKGFSNRFNVWKEKPYEDSYGFSLGPLGAFLSHENKERVLLITAGGEWKHFWSSYGFSRLGAYGNRMIGARSDLGWSALIGLGIEIPVGPAGVAFEYALQSGVFQKHGTWNMRTPSIGVHFYHL
ncbi:MAG: hypothetical protein AB8C84_04865 [Oligoflexales bacterium]